MNEFYWAIGIGEHDFDDDGYMTLIVKWLTKDDEFGRVCIDSPQVKLFETEEAAINYRDTHLDPKKCVVRKIHRDFIYI